MTYINVLWNVQIYYLKMGYLSKQNTYLTSGVNKGLTKEIFSPFPTEKLYFGALKRENYFFTIIFGYLGLDF